MSIRTFVLNLSDLYIHTTIKKNYIKIMPSRMPHQKFCFYHLPTRGRAGIKLGDADTSPTYLQFLIAPCYIIYCFGCLWALLYTFISFWD